MWASTFVCRRGVAAIASVAMNAVSVLVAKFASGNPAASSDEATQFVVARRRVGQQSHLVRGVKLHEIAERPPGLKKVFQPAIGEHALDEVLAEPGIGQAALLFDRKQPETAA